MRGFHRAVAVLVAVAVCVGLGCGSKGGRRAVSGSVWYKGQPLKNGTVTFLTAAGPQGGALVTDGAFAMPAEQGLDPGEYRVAVSMPEPGGVLTPQEKAA